MTTTEQAPPQPRFATLTAWMTEWFLPTWQHRLDPSQIWCEQWWQHAEAISRLETMWRSWEALRLDGPLGMATWWRDIADYLMHQLLDQHGPFAACRGAHNQRGADELQLPAQQPPRGWFDLDDQDDADEDTDGLVPRPSHLHRAADDDTGYQIAWQ
ncbi:DUF4913 domain-containing protein [Prauserella sp. PE36]|uniref:DUF4913 domain-containing protein n=1 Tax=Prauserella sp. PE36 TaxID=1504709 RepID=UPI000DE27574|nr:DUF4913 domain-containing protein [Prauserella sp. PE36]RBM18111.1 DUF4913 domain-containing protein [Prauserella sp. PE36]